MRISVLSIFPESFDSFRATPVVRRAITKGQLDFQCVDIKDFADGSFRKIDDSPCGGGPGMVLRVDTLSRALSSVRTPSSHVVMLSPKGKKFDQKKAHEFSKLEHLVLVCGHYEGIDARFEEQVNEMVSIGDYILTGGEFASMVICDSIVRLLKGSLREGSAEDESFETGLLEYPQYTHPVEYEGKSVPPVLLSGNQKEIGKWRQAQSILETAKYRPDLFDSQGFEENSIGQSGSRVIMFPDMVLKISETGEEERSELQALQFLECKLPVPTILGYTQNSGKSYLLTSRAKGKMLCDSSILNNVNRLYKSAIAALRMLWSVDISECTRDCTLDLTLDALLRRARQNIENNLVDTNNIEPETFGPEGFESPTALLEYLEANRPQENLVLSHGDLCLPNILVSCKGIEAFLDLGRCGVSDKWRDIAILTRSLRDNMAGRYGNTPSPEPFNEKLFFEMLGLEPDWEKIRYYRLLDELF